MSTRYPTEVANPTPLEVVNSATFGPAVRRAFHDMGRVDVTPYAIPWSGIDVPMVSDLPQSPSDRAEVNLIVGDGVSRMVYRRATDSWYGVDSGREWIAVTGSTGWANYGSGFQACQYSKGGDGIVRLRGLALWSGAGSALDLGTMPVGYRPAAQELWAAASLVGVQRIDIVPSTGMIAPSLSVGVGGWLSLSNIAYEAA